MIRAWFTPVAELQTKLRGLGGDGTMRQELRATRSIIDWHTLLILVRR